MRNIKKTYIYQTSNLKVRKDKLFRDGKEESYDVIERANSAIIIPLSSSGKTILIKQYRYPIGSYSFELPDGGLREDENPEDAAKRELLEETNIQANKLEKIGSFNPVPGLSNQKAYVFIAWISEEDINKALPNRAEEIDKIVCLHYKDIYKMVEKGEITDGFTLSSLLILKIYLEKTNFK